VSEAVVRWRSAETIDGDILHIPDAITLTSRMATGKRSHYALVCSTERPLEFANHGQVAFGALRNLLSGRSVGPSQVTAVVRLLRGALVGGAIYAIALRVRLVHPYFVRLMDPIRIDKRGGLEDGLSRATTPPRDRQASTSVSFTELAAGGRQAEHHRVCWSPNLDASERHPLAIGGHAGDRVDDEPRDSHQMRSSILAGPDERSAAIGIASLAWPARCLWRRFARGDLASPGL